MTSLHRKKLARFASKPLPEKLAAIKANISWHIAGHPFSIQTKYP